MKRTELFRKTIVLFWTACLSACAAPGSIIDSPIVDLTGVELTSASFQRQTFVLSFYVTNPNPFPLPIKAVEYRVMIDRVKFAGGRTPGNFTVPAQGDKSFAIEVELDILKSATHLASLFRGNFTENVAYELQGRLAIDLPLVNSISFSSVGAVNLTQTASRQFE